MNIAVLITLIAVAGSMGIVGLIFNFVSKIVKDHNEILKLKTQKEILELEIQKQSLQIKLQEEDNKIG